MVQNQSEDNLGGAEAGAHSISSAVAGRGQACNADLPKVQFCGDLWIEEAPLCRILFSHYKDSGPHKSSSFWVQWPILDITDLQKHAGDSAKGVCLSKKTMSNKDKSGSQVHQDTGLGTAPSSLPALFPVRVAATLEPVGHVLADSPMASLDQSPASCQPPW